MVTLMLAAALTSGTAAPGFHYYSGCYGCYGCTGGYPFAVAYPSYPYGAGYACWGGSGCFGGAFAGGFGGCGGGYGPHLGVGYNSWATLYPSYAGCGACSGYVYAPHYAPVIPAPARPAMKGATDEAAAKVTVVAPTAAKVWFNGVPVAVAGRRTFETPPLAAGGAYSYAVEADVLRGGAVVRERRRVSVSPGGAVTVDLTLPPER